MGTYAGVECKKGKVYLCRVLTMLRGGMDIRSFGIVFNNCISIQIFTVIMY